MNIRLVQFSPTLGDVKRNLQFHQEAIAQAVSADIDLVVFPELSLSGYQLQDIAGEEALSLRSPEILQIQKLSTQTAVIVGAPIEEPRGMIYNCALCFSGGELLHVHRKTQLPNYGMFQERMIFKPGHEFRTFLLNGFTVGLLVCREILFPVHGYLYYLQGTDLLVGISNSPFRGITQRGFSSFPLWETMGQVFSRFYHQHYLFVNRTGFEDGIGFGGGSFYAAPGAGIQKTSKLFSEDILDIQISLQEVRRARLASNYRRDEHPEMILRELERITHA